MGQVYRALDARLGRTVAIKILPPHFALSPDFGERFAREARVVSSLAHPNICAIFDVGEARLPRDVWSGRPAPAGDDQTIPFSYFVMEHLQGSTLRDRLEAGTVSRGQAIEIAAQVAAGLAAAHDRGLVHRDLKPDNIFITDGDVVKILDFGVAKLLGGDDTESTSTLTEPGVVVGTANYMSPEQVRGTKVDHRSDIFSFGVVFYEMLTGLSPFRRDSRAETMHAVLTDQPRSVHELVSGVPAGIEQIILRCLEKEPNRRFVSTRDLAFSIDAIARGTRPQIASGEPGVRTSGVRSATESQVWTARLRSRALIGAALAAALLLTVLAGRSIGRRPAKQIPSTRTVTHSGRDSSPAVSRDGKLIAFVSARDGTRRIWIKQISDGAEVPLTDGPNDSAPRFSPDGSAVAFTRTSADGFAVYRVSVVGGEARKILDNAFDADWSPDGRQLVFIRDRKMGVERLSVLGIAALTGGVREIATSKDHDLLFPRWSPDGKWLAVTRGPHHSGAGSILLIRPDGSDARVIVRPEPHGILSSVAWHSDSSAFVFAEMEALTARALQRRAGGARFFLHRLGTDSFDPVLWNPHASPDAIDVLGTGKLIFVEDFTRQNLQEVSLGKSSSSPRWVTRGSAVDRQPVYTADGKSIVFCSDRSGNADLWMLALDSGNLRRLTDDPGVDWDPAVTVDRKLLWSSNRSGHFEVWMSTGDAGSAKQISADGVDAENPSTSRDSSWVYYDSSHPSKEGLWRMRVDGTEARQVYAGETIHPEVSADGAYVVFHGAEAEGTSSVHVLRASDGVVFTLTSGLRHRDAGRARWLGATHTVVYRSPDDSGRWALFAQDFVPGVDTSATRRTLVELDADTDVETFAFSPDGSRAILSLLEPASSLMMGELPVEE